MNLYKWIKILHFLKKNGLLYSMKTTFHLLSKVGSFDSKISGVDAFDCHGNLTFLRPWPFRTSHSRIMTVY